ncbi:MAG: tetratricopeptide repeat protein [Planctomycetaceae bacterium]|nr:tetratricopeptide repeat protein [Planctomycetaceae bacterium]
MAKRKPHQPNRHRAAPARGAAGNHPARLDAQRGSAGQKSRSESTARPPRTEIRLRQTPGKPHWEFVHPRSVRDRAEDLEEVHLMIDGGEEEIAVEELRWLLEGCPDFIEAHKILGELAMTAGDVKLARAHFGYAYDLGMAALGGRELPGPLAYERPANQPFFEAAKGLAWSLTQVGLPEKAREVLQRMLRLEPSDPLGARGMLAQLEQAHTT